MFSILLASAHCSSPIACLRFESVYTKITSFRCLPLLAKVLKTFLIMSVDKYPYQSNLDFGSVKFHFARSSVVTWYLVILIR